MVAFHFINGNTHWIVYASDLKSARSILAEVLSKKIAKGLSLSRSDDDFSSCKDEAMLAENGSGYRYDIAWMAEWALLASEKTKVQRKAPAWIPIIATVVLILLSSVLVFLGMKGH